MLFPLVESTLSDDVLKTWERVRSRCSNTEVEDEDQLSQLMKFSQTDVESEAHLKMAKRGTSLEFEEDSYQQRKFQRNEYKQVTATDLMNKTESTVNNCIFCDLTHKSQTCKFARRMKMSVKNKKVMNSGRCFKCLQPNHMKIACKASVKCETCGKPHCTVMCIQNSQREYSINTVAISHHRGTTILQTLLITVEGENGKHIMRAIIDTGSHQSYISAPAAKILGLSKFSTFETAHSLFGGYITRQVKHSIYRTIISNQNTGYKQQVLLLDQAKICGSIPPVTDGPWIKELSEQGIGLSDFNSGQENIDILLGADIASTLFTGNMYRTKNGPVTFETVLGWTLMGKSVDVGHNDSTMILHSLHIGNAEIHDLWRLDLIGIHDPTESQSQDQLAAEALKHFQDNIKRTKDGRYEIALP